MKPLVVFLSSAGVRQFKNFMIFTPLFSDPTISGITCTSEIKVVSYKNGEKKEYTYPAGTTSVSVESDARSNVTIFGDITSFDNYIYSGTIFFETVKVRSKVLTVFSAFADGGATSSAREFDFSGCALLSTVRVSGAVSKLNITGCTSISVLAVKNPLVSMLDLSDCKTITKLTLSYAGALRKVVYGQETKVVEYVLNGTSITEESLLLTSALTAMQIDDCALIGNVDLSKAPNLTKISSSGSSVFNPIGINELMSLTEIRIERNQAVVDVSPKSTNLTKLTLSDCLSLETIKTSAENMRLELSSNMPALKSVDASSMSDVQAAYSISSTINVPVFDTLKARAVDSTNATRIAVLITNSGVSDGVVYLNSADSYYSTVATAATTKGWTIEPLA